jgi:hypothetical protein
MASRGKRVKRRPGSLSCGDGEEETTRSVERRTKKKTKKEK